MLPRQPLNQLLNGAPAYAVLLCERSNLATLAGEGIPNRNDICLGQSAAAIGCAAMVAAAPTTIPIDSVIQTSARPQVCRVAARRVVATMKNEGGVVGQFAAIEDESDAMRQMRFAPFSSTARVLDTVSSVVAVARPLPALIRTRLADLLPKRIDLSWGNINTHRVVLTLGATPGAVDAAPRLSALSFPLYQMGGAR